ncbi:hypothetical protein EDB85DRAFT_2143697 [Lactarius pseudohatsudake]|nr:hypothetical protein EDB85DRAFT_2143697 [Lactarius pseudohatsudake]
MRAILRRTALTNILCMIKTDFKTLHGSNFAEIAQSDAVQLAWFPGFGLQKVARLDNVFERLIHMDAAGDSLPAAFTSVITQTSAPTVSVRPSDGDSARGPMGVLVNAVWDMELDLNSPLS